jgi:hypothetical protein
MKTDYTKVAEALKKTTGKGEKPMSAGIVPAPQTPEIALSEQAVGVLEKMRIPTADYEKYARTPSRSLLNIGGNKV